MTDKIKKRKFPKPKVIGEIPLLEINGEVWGFEVSELSKEEQEFLKNKPQSSPVKKEVKSK